MKGLWTEVVDRVFKSWGSTLLGIALAVGIQLVDVFTGWVSTNLPAPWGAILSGVIALAGAFLKSGKLGQPAAPPAS